MQETFLGEIPTMDVRRGSFTNRDIALVAGFAALYLGYGYVSSLTLRTATRSLDLFFLIAVLFTILASITRRAWSSTLLGTVTGILFLGQAFSGAPFSPHIPLSLVANGIVFDSYVRFTGSETSRYERNHLIVAAALGNFVMALVGLGVLQAVGILGSSSSVIYWVAIYATFSLANIVVGALGALLGSIVITRLGARRTQRLIR